MLLLLSFVRAAAPPSFCGGATQRPRPQRSRSAAARVRLSLRRAEEIIYGACLSGVNSRRRRPAPSAPRGRQSGGVHLLHQVDGAVVKSSTFTRDVSSVPAAERLRVASVAHSVAKLRLRSPSEAWSPLEPPGLVCIMSSASRLVPLSSLQYTHTRTH